MCSSIETPMLSLIYVLAKNESANIDHCLEQWSRLGVPIVVLDSGSTDGTIERASSFPGVIVESFAYTNHCAAYNAITCRHTRTDAVAIVDADMRPRSDFRAAVDSALGDYPRVDVVLAPVSMFWAGHALPHGSLYPPKAVVFRGGQSYFEPAGHGERLLGGVKTETISSTVSHDDRRDYGAELQKQWRYALTTIDRVRQGRSSWEDRVRIRWPLFILITPGVSFLLKLGVLSGRVGRLYALDRMIAEAIIYRAGLVDRLAPGGET